MLSKEPAAVLIHGHHLQAPDWETLVWGTEGLGSVGRIPRGIEIAVKEDAQLIMWGTGASLDLKTGKKESEYTHDLALSRASELGRYVGLTESEVAEMIRSRSYIQRETTNTKDEVYEALKLCKEKGIHTLYLVSTSTHVPRCLLTACQFQDEFPDIVLCGVAASAVTAYWSPKDTVVVEPSHRPDRADVPMQKLAKRLAGARKYPERAQRLYDDVAGLLDVFDKEI